MASEELLKKLQRRQDRCEVDEESNLPPPEMKNWNPAVEMKGFTRKQIQEFSEMFKKFDADNDKKLDLVELKALMQSINCAQTHLQLKQMIADVGGDSGGITETQFLQIFAKAQDGEFDKDSALYAIFSSVTSIDVDETGVGGAAAFFTAKIAEQERGNAYADEIRREQEARAREEAERSARKQQFKEKSQLFAK